MNLTLQLQLLLLIITINVGYSLVCSPIYVRWPRVRLNLTPAIDGALPFGVCKKGCSNDEDPLRSSSTQQCSAFNHRNSPHPFSHQCQIFPKENVQHIDGYIEADDRYSFYWKYCVKTDRKCTGDFAFTFLSDRYMSAREVTRVVHSKTLEDCLAECLNANDILCRSASFNRTDGGCHLSQQNQLSKPALIKLNNNPNYRIDYYENNCFNIAESFKFDYKCQKDGIKVTVNSKFPYTGALYGLYDFFTCRVEPKELTKFEYLFPYPTLSRNCSDSIRFKGNDMILEVVLSTDGVEPLYFITPDDLTYQARCPIEEVTTELEAVDNFNTRISFPTKDKINLSSINNPTTGAEVDKAATVTSVTSTTAIVSTTPSSTTTTSTTTQSTTTPTTTTPSTTTTTTTVVTSPSTSPVPITTQSTTVKAPPKSFVDPNSHRHGDASPPASYASGGHPPGTNRPSMGPDGKPTQPVIFDIFHNGQPTEAVVVGNKITLSFTPYYAIPPAYMFITGCQVEPVGSPFEWEREPLPIVKDGCQADNVGLVCPPQKTDYGIRVTVEAFRYQSTMQVEYTCLIRVCPFTTCPTTSCNTVDGCPRDDLISRSFGLRAKRQLSLDQIREALAADPSLHEKLALLPSASAKKMSHTLSQQLLTLSGDHKVSKRLVVLNSDDELQYYVRTGAVPDN